MMIAMVCFVWLEFRMVEDRNETASEMGLLMGHIFGVVLSFNN